MSSSAHSPLFRFLDARAAGCLRLFAGVAPILGLLPLISGCPPRGGRTAPRGLDAPGLTGTWVGDRLDTLGAGVHRRTAVRLTVRADGQGGLGGELAVRGTVDAGPGKRLDCAPRSAAVVKRVATMTVGQYRPSLARFRLAEPSLEGVRGCARHFPFGRAAERACLLRPADSGAVQLRCGGFALRLRRTSLTGVWAWDEHRGDRTGDTLREHLRLHLTQHGDRIVGFADDIRVRVSGDKQRFRCNGRLSYARQGRHELRGRLRGLRFGLEVRQTRASRGPCQGKLTVPGTWQGIWDPISDRITVTLGTDKRTLWRRPVGRDSSGNGRGGNP